MSAFKHSPRISSKILHLKTRLLTLHNDFGPDLLDHEYQQEQKEFFVCNQVKSVESSTPNIPLFKGEEITGIPAIMLAWNLAGILQKENRANRSLYGYITSTGNYAFNSQQLALIESPQNESYLLSCNMYMRRTHITWKDYEGTDPRYQGRKVIDELEQYIAGAVCQRFKLDHKQLEWLLSSETYIIDSFFTDFLLPSYGLEQSGMMAGNSGGK